MIRLKEYIKKRKCLLAVVKMVFHPWVTVVGWLYGAYLTIRYVDEYSSFPAVRFEGGLIHLKIKKALNAKLILKGNLIISPFAGGSSPSSLYLRSHSVLILENDFVIGDDVRISLAAGATLNIGGKKNSSGSGITCQCKVLVAQSVSIGADTIIAWDVLITDADHHPVNGELAIERVIIGEHVWITPGCQILKGSCVGQDSIVANKSVVLRGEYPDGSLLAGTPAQIKGKAPSWSRD